MKGSDKTDQNFKVGILNEVYRNNTASERQTGSNPKSRDKIGYIIIIIIIIIIFIFSIKLMERRKFLFQ